MIVIMKENATEKQMKQVIDLVTGAGLTFRLHFLS
jgi:3-deoxy-7-phosphoheptulonate synthase